MDKLCCSRLVMRNFPIFIWNIQILAITEVGSSGDSNRKYGICKVSVTALWLLFLKKKQNNKTQKLTHNLFL